MTSRPFFVRDTRPQPSRQLKCIETFGCDSPVWVTISPTDLAPSKTVSRIDRRDLSANPLKNFASVCVSLIAIITSDYITKRLYVLQEAALTYLTTIMPNLPGVIAVLTLPIMPSLACQKIKLGRKSVAIA